LQFPTCAHISPSENRVSGFYYLSPAGIDGHASEVYCNFRISAAGSVILYFAYFGVSTYKLLHNATPLNVVSLMQPKNIKKKDNCS